MYMITFEMIDGISDEINVYKHKYYTVIAQMVCISK